MSGMQLGERAYRITYGKYKGQLCWLYLDDEHKKIGLDNIPKSHAVRVQLIKYPVPYYGTWGGEVVRVNRGSLSPVEYVGKWSDE